MNKLTITRGNQEANIWINDTKYLIGPNFKYKYELVRNIKQYCVHSISETSEFSKSITSLKINDHPVNYKKVNLFEVNQYWDLTTDLKLGTKSMILKWLEVKLQSVEYIDLINTLNFSLRMLADEVSAENDFISINSNDFNYKAIAKLLIPKLVGITEDEMNLYDLSYDLLLALQLKMINDIVAVNNEVNLIIIDLRIISTKLLQQISQMKNCYILVLSNSMDSRFNYEDIVLCKNKILDLADEETLYDFFNNENRCNWNLKEIKEYMDTYLHGKWDNNTEIIDRLLG